MSFNPNQHHRRSIRLKTHNYSGGGCYFLTICSYQRQCLFGKISNGQMHLNDYGIIVQNCWRAIPEHFSQADLSDFVVMPNHLHGILAIASDNQTNSIKRRFGKPMAGSLGTIVGSFKSAATKQINRLRNAPGTPLWQRNYYEHVIRNDLALERIRDYVRNNPRTWERDQLHSDGGVER